MPRAAGGPALCEWVLRFEPRGVLQECDGTADRRGGQPREPDARVKGLTEDRSPP